MKATALIAEDEALQREALREILSSLWPELEIVAECGDGLAALEALQAHRPQIAFLDIRMPGVSGLEVARQASAITHVVFTTAYDEHAVAAFETGAVDYVLKPVTADRIGKTLERLRLRINSGKLLDLDGLIDSIRQIPNPGGTGRYKRWITASVGSLIKMFAAEDVLFFMADDKCTRVVSRNEESVIRMSLKELLRELDPEAFWQIHRSVIVQVGAIKSIRRNELGALEVSLDGSSEILPVSQAYRERFRGM